MTTRQSQAAKAHCSIRSTVSKQTANLAASVIFSAVIWPVSPALSRRRSVSLKNGHNAAARAAREPSRSSGTMDRYLESLQDLERQSGFAEASPVARSGLFFRQGESNTWRFVLNRQQTEEVLANHSKMMQALGYIPPNLDDIYGAPDGTAAFGTLDQR